MEHIATFYSHFGAVRFKKLCDSRQVAAKVMPVPRNLSSSCGTCVHFEGEAPDLPGVWLEELEQIVAIEAGGYRALYRAEQG